MTEKPSKGRLHISWWQYRHYVSLTVKERDSSMDERAFLDSVIKNVSEEEKIELPNGVKEALEKWKWGTYGWVSPASLIISAALHKHLYPDVDCCKIWANDENENPIPGGYSIRWFDENVTIPMLAKHDLCKNFCSPNSGMQGSRAIEKMRGLKRLDRNFANSQRTIFDLQLFASILNDIEELTPEESLEVLRYTLQIAKKVQQKRLSADAKVSTVLDSSFNPWVFLADTKDPELTKCYVAACLKVIYGPSALNVEGVSDHRTAADARAGKPGDITLTKNNKHVAAIEVKDKSQEIDWQNIERAVNVINNHPEITYFAFVLESTKATVTDAVREILLSSRMKSGAEEKIIVLGLYQLYLQALSIVNPKDFAELVGAYMAEAPDVKPETKSKWINETN